MSDVSNPVITPTFASDPAGPAAEPLLETIDLCTWFPIQRGILSRTVGHVKAVDSVNLTIYPGETLGLVGESGCGKTTFGRTILGLEKPTSGEILYRGINLIGHPEHRVIRLNLQMIFQDPYSSLNPRMTILDIVTEGLVEHRRLNGQSREEAARRLLSSVGLNVDSLDRYPHEFSGGQRQRICVARAISLEPEFIVCDEAVSALDVSVQAQVLNLLMDLRERLHLSYLFISHDLRVVRHISHRVAVMYLGQVVELGPTDSIITDPAHPYTQALVAAIPLPGSERRERIVLQNDPPSPANPPPGCRFHTRCPLAIARCHTEAPLLRRLGDREVACHRAGEKIG